MRNMKLKYYIWNVHNISMNVNFSVSETGPRPLFENEPILHLQCLYCTEPPFLLK